MHFCQSITSLPEILLLKIRLLNRLFCYRSTSLMDALLLQMHLCTRSTSVTEAVPLQSHCSYRSTSVTGLLLQMQLCY